MKIQVSTLVMIAVLSCASTAEAQRMQDRGRRGGPGNGPPPPGSREGDSNGFQDQQGLGSQVRTNQNGSRNMPSVQQLAQMMIANFDADGSNELGATELQNALAALRQMMQTQGNRSNQNRPQQNALTNQQDALQGRQTFQASQRQGNRPPPARGQGNARPRR